MGTPRDAIILAIVTVLAIEFAVQLVPKLAESAARRLEAVSSSRADASDGEPYPSGGRWV